MKKNLPSKLSLLFACLSLWFISSGVNAQTLTGTKTIPGSYPSIQVAIDSLNTYGVGGGGVIFNIAAGYAELLTQKLMVTATGTAANPIVFQKSGTGANPVVTAYTGTRTATSTDSIDVMWAFLGSDYVTITGIDLKDTIANSTPTMMMEAGYGFYKTSTIDGCNNNTIQNCTITLNRDNFATGNAGGPFNNVSGSVGIEVMACSIGAVNTTIATGTISGANSNNSFYGNTIQNCNIGIALSGYAAPTPYTLGDANNDIGGSSLVTGNTIINFGGGASANNACAAIYISNQWSFNISYNTVNNNDGNGINHPTTNRGIWLNSGSNGASCDVNNNIITITAGSSLTVSNYCIDVEMALAGNSGNTINILNNQLLNCKATAAATSGIFTAILLNTTATTLNVSNNYIYGFTYGASATSSSGVIMCAQPVGTLNITNNTIDSTVLTGGNANGNWYQIAISLPPTIQTNITGNTLSRMSLNTTGAGVQIIYGIYFSSGAPTVPTTYNIINNTIDGITRNGTTGGTTYGIYHTGGAANISTMMMRKNIIRNISISGSGTSNAMTGMQFGSGTVTCDSNEIYNIACLKSTGTGTITALVGSNTSIETTTANTIYNITHAGTGNLMGLNSTGAANAIRKVSYNTIYGLSSGGAVYGIFQSTGWPTVYNNKIYDLATTTTASSAVSGIFISAASPSSPSPLRYYNNVISDLRAATSTGGGTAPYTPTVRGINITATTANTTFAFYNNTILLNGTSSGTNFTTTGIFHTYNVSSTAGVLELRNNIIVNNTTPTGSGIASVLWRTSSTDLNNFSLASNRNLFYAGTPSATHVILNEALLTYQDSIAYRTKVSPRDTNSFFSENPVFLSTNGTSAQFLKLDPTVATFAEGSGRNNSGITQDYGNNVRAGNAGYFGMGGAPDMGAWEADHQGYAVNQEYFDSATADQPITSVIASASSNNIILKVRVYANNGYNALKATSFKLNTATTTTVADIAAAKIYCTGNDNNFSTAQLFGTATSPGAVFTITGSKRLAAGVNYFWVVYDISNTATPGNFVDAAVDSVVVTDSITTVSTNQPLITNDPAGNRMIKPKFSGNTDVGSSSSYTSLTMAMNELSALGVSGPVTFTLTDAQYDTVTTGEVFPIVLRAYPGSSATNTVTIRPASGNASRIVGIGMNPVIQFNGGSNYIIDGSQGGNGIFVPNNNLIIENTNKLASTISFVNDADSNRIFYVDVKGADTLGAGTAGAGVVNFGTTTGVSGNDNNTIRYCDIHAGAGGNPSVAISAIGTGTTAATFNDNNTIANCNIYDFYAPTNSNINSGIYVGANNGSWTIKKNQFYQTAKRTFTSSVAVLHRIVWVTPTLNNAVTGSGFTIDSNYIGGSASDGSGLYEMAGPGSFQFYGIDVSVGKGAATSVQGNVITNINDSSAATSGTAASFISLCSGKINCNGNLMGSQTTNGAITMTFTGATNGAMYGIRTGAGALGSSALASTDTLNITNNILSGIDLYANNTTTVAEFFGIIPSGGFYVNVSNNLVGDTLLANSIHLVSTSATTATAQRVAGFYINPATTLGTYLVSGNIISNITNEIAASGAVVSSTKGINLFPGGAGNTFMVTNNIIKNISTATASTGTGNNAGLIGLATVNTSSNYIISGNSIYNLKLTAATPAAVMASGICFFGGAGGNNQVTRNAIHSIEVPATNPSAIITGIDITAGVPIVANNMIRLGIDGAGADITTPCSFRGISKGATTSTGIYYNTVYIGGASAGGNGNRSYAFQRTGAGTDNVVNNIFYNARTNGSTGGGNFALALNNSTTLVENFNLFKGDSIGVFNNVTYYTLSDWKTGAPGLDVNTVTNSMDFVNETGNAATVDLHIDTTTATPIEASGFALSPTITGIDVDFDGQSRYDLTPFDLGADAGDFPALDIAPPVITYTALANSIDSTNRTVTATIKDATGVYVATSSLFAPRIYFSKSGMLPTWFSATGTKATGTEKNGTWLFTINTALFPTAPTGGDSIYYFVVAQDSTGANNMSSFPGGAQGTDVNNISIAPTSPSWYRVVPVVGSTTIPVGTGQTFTTLTGANGLFSYLNTSVLNGDVVVQLVTDSIEEPGTVGLNQLAETGLGGYKVRIEPDAAAERLLVGNITTGGSGLIRFDGCDRVTIDGSYAGSGKHIRIKNRGNGNTIHLVNDADKDTITNCVVEGMNTYAATIVFNGTNVSGGTGNDSNAIIGCIIRDTVGATGANLPNTGFYSVTGNNDYNTFSDNEVYNFGYGGMYVEASKVDNFWTITNNKFYQQRLKNVDAIVIRVHSGSGHTISGNSIGGAAADRSGAAWTTSSPNNGTYGFAAVGILIPNTIATVYPINITDNIISNFGSSTSNSAVSGILVNGGVVNIKNNTIGGGMNPYDTIITGGGSATTDGMIELRPNSAASIITVYGNLVSNISYYSGSAVGTTGIVVNSSLAGSILVDSNTVKNIVGNNTSTIATGNLARLAGIIAATANYPMTITRNRVSNIQSINKGTAAYAPVGILISGGTSVGTIVTRNWIKNIGAVGTGIGAGAPVVHGINMAAGGNALIANNQISIGDSAMNETVVYGMSDFTSTSGSNTYAYNSVYVNGTTGAGANASSAFYRQGTTPVNVINNILYNKRTTLGTGANYAAAFNNASGVNSTTLNYNLMLVGDTSKLMMLPSGTNKGWSGLNALYTTTNNTNWAQDTNVVDETMLFVNAAEGDLHIATANPEAWYANGKGKRITTLSGDFDNAIGVRSISLTAGSTDIGSVEFTPTSTPPLANADKAPAAGDSTLFFFGSRMVAKLNWDFTGSLPTSVDARFYSGEKAPNLIAGRTAMNAYWDFQTNGGSAYGSVLTLMMDSTYFGDVVNASNLNVAKYDGTQWTKDSNTIINNIEGTFTAGITNIGGLGIYTGTDGTNNPLPVRMTTFTAKVNNGDVIVDWKTASEMNNRGFEIERSLDGRSFETVGFVKGAGNSNTVLSYMYNDKAAFAKTSAQVLYYRLKQVDMNGAFNYSNIARVSLNNKEVNAVSAYPNPFTTEMQVSFNAAAEGKALVRILNIQGMTVTEQTATASKGMNRLDIESLTSLPKGMYFVELTVNGETTVVKVVKN